MKGSLKIKTDTLYLISALGFEKTLGLGRQRKTDLAMGAGTRPRYPSVSDQICKIYNISINKTLNHYAKVPVWDSGGLHRQLQNQ